MKCPHCLVEVLPAFAFDYIGLDKDGGWGVEYMKCPNHDCQRLIIMLAEGQPAKWGTQEVLRPIRSRWLMRPRGANRPAPPEVPKPFADEYHEAGLVLADSPKASAALARRTLQRLLREIEKVKPADLADEIQEMLDRKTLPSHLAEQIDADPALVNKRFSELDCGMTGGRLLTLQGGTLLHVAAEYGHLAAAALLLDQGADVNARAAVDEAGVGGHTAIFHAVTQFDDGGLPVTQVLIERGADLSVRVKLPGDYERPGEIVECTALGYALLFGGPRQRRTVTLLRERGAVE